MSNLFQIIQFIIINVFSSKKQFHKGGIFISKRKELFCSYLWEKGFRDNNEDSLVFWQMQKEKECKVLAVICDGIGGLSGGEQASGYVVRQVANWFMSRGYLLQGKKQATELQQFLFQIHEEIKEYGKEKGNLLGTTTTVVLMDNYKVHWFQCGDCRLYLFKNGRVRKITTDHRDEKGNLNRAIGVGHWNGLEEGYLRIGKKDRILLCSDGLYRNLKTEELKTWFRKKVYNDEQAKRMLKQLFQKKLALGEKDNLSALYFGYVKNEDM